MKRTLRLRKEMFTDLTPDQLGSVAGANATPIIDLVTNALATAPTNVDVCLENTRVCLTGTCFTDGANCTQYCYPIHLTNRPGVCS